MYLLKNRRRIEYKNLCFGITIYKKKRESTKKKPKNVVFRIKLLLNIVGTSLSTSFYKYLNKLIF